MIPKLEYVINGVTKTHTFDPGKHSTFTQEWEAEELEYKNPFTRERRWKRWGYYYKATITYEGIEYLYLDLDIRDFFSKNVTSRKFYPDKDSKESYDVDVNDGLSMNDEHVAMAYSDVSIVLRGKNCYETPLNYPVGHWGDRSHSFLDLAAYTFAELSGA